MKSLDARPWFSAALLALVTLGCEEAAPTSPSVTSERSQSVMAPAGSKPAAATTAAPAAEKPAAGPRKEALCSSKPNSALPTSAVSGLGARTLPFAGGKPVSSGLTWVNLWAAWCEPCKKELPLLHDFQAKLKKQGVRLELAFLSIDDDQRQLQQFLDNQPNDGLKRTFWLREGKERDEWLAGANVPADPRLPVHLLLDRDGKVFCRIDGQIEASDFDEVAQLFASK